MGHTLIQDTPREAAPCTSDGSPWGLLPQGRKKRRCWGKPKAFLCSLKDGGRIKGGRGRESVSQSPLFGPESQRTEVYQGGNEEISSKTSVQLVVSNTGMKIPNEGTLSQTKFGDDSWLGRRAFSVTPKAAFGPMDGTWSSLKPLRASVGSFTEAIIIRSPSQTSRYPQHSKNQVSARLTQKPEREAEPLGFGSRHQLNAPSDGAHWPWNSPSQGAAQLSPSATEIRADPGNNRVQESHPHPTSRGHTGHKP